MAEFQYIDLQVDSKHATLWLNRPDRHNAFDAAMLNEIISCMAELGTNTSIRSLVLRGYGESFCSGANLGWFADPLTMTQKESETMASLMIRCFEAIRNFSVPVIAAVHGHVMGGGLGFMCAADIVMADENTLFAFPEVKTGLAPSTISPYVLKRLSPGKAKLYMLTGKKIIIEEALQFGLVDMAVHSEDFELQLTEITDTLACVAPNAVKEIKILINTICERPINKETQDLTRSSFVRMRTGSEFKDGMTAFYEKRKPNWTK